ncbi:ketopantoate reductase family protein [Fructilactobacillus fructivorans]|uniref:Ketopantoate reductase family protein n=1 Tax=Fructilactobacillus fructivorans TaxID=1614 RepID=A0AAE6NZI9_9LACO|nr:2-dehydropantoate 2-reductase N-terminal domain-containing protein [Fructilactobacillus fructivorans]KRK58242.1 2-dehydropantoate 2-reductase [Fructilactobacillus fructivorans]QFX92230.1 ketopantoate reductase family protein [Fructilactobacillus fructivorans]RDV65279.1 ketopantoate reductase family protein [Fructilactobacillus fructivorans]
MKIAIYGAGSLGTIIGAYLTKAYGKKHVDLIANNDKHIGDLNSQGAHVNGSAEFRVPVSGKIPCELHANDYDLVLLLTKQPDNDKVLDEIRKVLKPDGTLVSLQNGVPEATIAEVIDPEQMVAGSVEFGGRMLKNNEAEINTLLPAFEKNAFQIGELNGKDTLRIRIIQHVLSFVGGTRISGNILGAKWANLLVSASFGGLSAAGNVTYGQVANDAIGLKGALHLISEGLQVGAAEGINFANMGEYDPYDFALNGQYDEDMQLNCLRRAFTENGNLKSSMLYDLKRNRPTEVHDINGLIASKGRKHYIETPFNDLIIQIIDEAQDTNTIPDFADTKDRFADLMSKEFARKALPMIV